MNVVTLGNGKQIPIGAYVAGIKKAIENPEMKFSHGLCGWHASTGREIRREFYRMVQDHCNRGAIISAKDKGAIISKAYKHGRPSRCRNCGQAFTRMNPHNDNDRFCSPRCREDYWI